MSDAVKKDSTNELPMYDLGEAVKLVVSIHKKALETAALPDVAKGCGYANPTSTPFYRRLLAARLFKLLNAPRAELTKIATDYLEPDTEEAKQNALMQAIMGIKIYAEIVNQHIGKKINVEPVTNRLEKDQALSLSRACAKICAYTFHSSLMFAGFIAPDGTVAIPLRGAAPLKNPPEDDAATPKNAQPYDFELKDDAQIQTLFLDNSRKRKVVVQAPFTVTKEELERIKNWFSVVLIIQGIGATDEPKQEGK